MSQIDKMAQAAGPYKKWVLEARQDYIKLRLRQDPEIRSLYIRAANRIAREIRRLGAGTQANQLKIQHLAQLEFLLRVEAEKLTADMTSAMKRHITAAVAAGTSANQNILLEVVVKSGAKLGVGNIKRIFASVNQQAVEACWARTKKGLRISDRIWRQGENMRNTMRDIIQESVAAGQDAVKTARMIEQYVKRGKGTLAEDYPDMMGRMGGRIPKDISYEALRLARAEMTAAFGEGTVVAAQAAPSYKGMQWVLSKSHPVRDICDDYANHSEGLGRGVYSPGNEPPMPAHPNCLCTLVPVHEKPEDFVRRLKKWQENPSSDQKLSEWYYNIYLERR